MRNFILTKIAHAIVKAPVKIMIAALALTAVCTWYSATHLELHTDQDDLISEKIEYHKKYKDFVREFGDLEYLYVVVEVEDNLTEAKTFIKSLAGRLQEIPEIKEVTYQINNPVLEKSFLLYLSRQQIDQLGAFLTKGPTAIQNIARWDDINDVLGAMNTMMEAPNLESSREEMTGGFQFLNALIDGLDSTLISGVAARPQLAGAFLGSDQMIDEEGFLLTPNGKLLFCLIMPEKSYDTLSVIEKPLQKIRDVLEQTKTGFPNIKAGLTGRPVLQADEMSVTNRDMTRATILALIAVFLLFILYFKKITRPLMAIASLVCGLSWTFGITTLVVGYLNLLSSVFAVILIGAGIEFGLQIVSRYREDLHEHKDPRHAVLICVTKTGFGNITAALTTAAAFFSALFIQFKALSELGFIAGSGILLCLASIIVVLPTLMYLKDRGHPASKLSTRLLIDLHGITKLYNRPKTILVILILATIAGLPGLWKLKFDHNLLNLQAKGLESVEYEKMIIEKSDESTWYAVSITKTPAESVAIAKQMKNLETVGKVESYETIVPPDQGQKVKDIGKLKGPFDMVNFVPIDNNLDISATRSNLKRILDNLARLTEMAFSSGYTEAVEELGNISSRVEKIYGGLSNLSEKQKSSLTAFQNNFLTEFRKGLGLLKDGLSPTQIKMGDLPASIQKRFVSPKGNYATYIYPKDNIWEPEKMKVFVREIRSIDPNAVGTPIEVFESSKLLQTSFEKAGVYAFLAIIIIVLLDFKRPKNAALSIVGLMAGLLWLLEIMGWAGIPFNLANFFAIPIILGVGVDNGVQIVHRYLQEGRTVSMMGKSTGAAVLLTSLTTAISFGTLTISAHRGIQSLGFIMALGSLTCLVGSMLLLPAILKLVSRK